MKTWKLVEIATGAVWKEGAAVELDAAVYTLLRGEEPTNAQPSGLVGILSKNTGRAYTINPHKVGYHWILA